MPCPKRDSVPRVVRIRRSDEADAHVLLHVSRTKSPAHELNITATEGESPYATTVRQTQLQKLRTKQYQGNDDDWRNIILHILGVLEEPENHSDLLTGVEASATINGSGDEDKELILIVRKRIQDITQKLGSLTLHQDDEQSIELFEWSNIAVARADSLEKRYTTLLARFQTAEENINSLNKQLEELIASKTLHEQQLMSDFVHLLNEKKLKIRNQQRLLASAKVDPEKLSMIQKATAADHSRPNAKGRNFKRSVGAIDDDGSESDDGFEKMDLDQKQQVDDGSDEETDDQGPSTPQPIEDDDTTTDDEGFAASTGGTSKEPKVKRGPPERAVAKSPPPRRELPFARKAQKEPAPSKSPPAQDPNQTGGETDDDEL